MQTMNGFLSQQHDFYSHINTYACMHTGWHAGFLEWCLLHFMENTIQPLTAWLG